ncbi:hypothetical protein Tco_1004792 [Tanacetum coccineum]|uniref:Peptidase A2 domain-containing protein n=1 Tax=Tanacetum coccineum TaxID=301880 RepID=A0ABQ5FDL5_9ASTR
MLRRSATGGHNVYMNDSKSLREWCAHESGSMECMWLVKANGWILEVVEGEDNHESLNDRMERHRDWKTLELQDTTCSQEKKETKAFTFYRMETKEMRKRYIAPCFVNVLEAYDGEIDLEQDKNLISNEFAVKKPLTQEDAAREEIAIDIYKRFSILEEERPVIETMTYSEKYKKILDSIFVDTHKLDGEIKQKEEVVKRVMGEALKEKEDPSAFVIPISLEAKINLNALADTGSDINAEPMGLLKDVLCQVGVTTIIVKFLILDMLVDKEVPILVERGFLATCESILNTIDRVTSTFDRIFHQTFRAAQTSINTKESDSDDEEEYNIKKNSFIASIYRPKSLKYLNCNDPMDRALALLEVLNHFRKICVWKKDVGFLGSFPVPLQHLDWKPIYLGNFCRKVDGDGQWHAEIRLTDPYENIYDQGFVTKKTSMKLYKYHKLSDVKSPNWFQE